MKILSQTFVVFFVSILILSGCNNKTEEEAVKEAKDIAQTTFDSSEKIKANNEVNKVPLYFPENLEVQSGDENNIILEDGDQTYIIFHNELEESTSNLNYQSAQNKSVILLESFEDAEKFGFIRILPDEGEGYQLQVGVGGAKITTYTTKRNLSNDAEEMMKMAKFMALRDSKDISLYW